MANIDGKSRPPGWQSDGKIGTPPDMAGSGMLEEASWSLPGILPATVGNHGVIFFIATRAVQVTACRERHATAGSDGSAVTGMLTKVPSGTAAGSGTAMLTAGLSYKATADTNQSGALSATLATLQLAAGDGLAVVLTGTPTALVGVAWTVELKEI